MDGEKCLQEEINGHQILMSGGPKPDVQEPPTDVRLLAGFTLSLSVPLCYVFECIYTEVCTYWIYHQQILVKCTISWASNH